MSIYIDIILPRHTQSRDNKSCIIFSSMFTFVSFHFASFITYKSHLKWLFFRRNLFFYLFVIILEKTLNLSKITRYIVLILRLIKISQSLDLLRQWGSLMTPFTKSVMDKPFFENLTAIFGMCSLEVSVLIYKTFLIRSDKFPYHKIFKYLKNLLKK